jgi:predicted PurR-regulated permease PerM
MIEGDHAYGWFMSFLSPDNRLRLAVTLYKAEIRMSKWLFGQGTLMLILGVCSIIAFGLLGVRYFVLLGVLMGLMNIIPIAGGVITILLVALVAALDSWAKMAGVFAFYLVYINVENAWLIPRIMRSSVNLMGLAVLIALIVGTELAGIPGALPRRRPHRRPHRRPKKRFSLDEYDHYRPERAGIPGVWNDACGDSARLSDRT